MSGRNDRLRVGVISTGREGPVLALALAGAGHEIAAFSVDGVSVDAGSAGGTGGARLEGSLDFVDHIERVNAMLPGVPIKTKFEVVKTAELVILAVSANELPGLVTTLSDAECWQTGQLVMHTSPEHGYSVFNPALLHGVIPMAFHPAMVFTGTSLDLMRLQEATVAVSAPKPVLPIVQALAVEMGAEPVIVAEEDRAAYADAVDALMEFTSALVKQTATALEEIGLEHVRRTVASIARGAIDATLGSGFDDPLDSEYGSEELF